MCWVGCQPRVELRKRNEQEYEQQKLTCSKLRAVVAKANFQQRKTKKKICGFLSGIVSEKRLLSCSQWSARCRIGMKTSLTKAKERATSACSCRRVSVQRNSVQYKGYNLIGVTTVEGSTTRGTTALVYWQLHNSLYTDAVQGWWSTPNWSDRRQGCTQVSTVLLYVFNL
jgi:hypothetical protein